MSIIGQQLLAPEAGWKRINDRASEIKGFNSYEDVQIGCWNGEYSRADGYGGTLLKPDGSITFTGGKLRVIGYHRFYDDRITTLYIDDVFHSSVNQSTKNGATYQVVDFEVVGLSESPHTAKFIVNSNQNYYLDAIDIDSNGILVDRWTYKTKTSTSQMKLGDRISIEYTAIANTFGTFANMGKATKPEIPITSTATPDGTFYLYHAGYDYSGKMILAADRNIQHSISWDTLNIVGVASGSGLPIEIDSKKGYIVRLPTGGVTSADKDNEWDKIIAESTLNGTITAGDNSVWNWNGLWSYTSTMVNGVSDILRGSQTANGYNVCTSPYTAYVGATVCFRPIILVEPNNAYYLFLKDDYTCHSWDGTSLTKVSNDWRQETFENQTTLFLAGTQSVPNVSILQPLLKCKVLVYSDDTAMGKPTGAISAVPHNFFVKPKNLISLASFEGVDNVSLTSTISGAGACHILITTDLVNYKTWNGTSWAIVDTSDLSAIVLNGLTPSALSAVPRLAWDTLTSGKGGIAFGYLPTIESVSDNAAVDKLTFTVDMKGSWDRAVHGIDYGYGYPQNNILRVTLKTNGDYKINYSEGCVSQ